MKRLLLLICCIAPCLTNAQAPEENYPVDPASEEHAGVPKGEILKLTFDQSKIFPGTWREYWVYVPAQYRPDTPACVYVNQDGVQWKAPTVFDNLIHQKEMPVTIGVFVMHGRVKAADPNAANDRFNRSFEYDGLGDGYARFILEEILPEVEKQKTSDGRAIRLSKNGNDRAIGGSSSGAVCAFTAAWERPEAFTRVFSAIGTYVGLRGADRYPTLVRKYEPKPIRIYMQDGANDLNIYAGDWWMANQTMLRALTFAGYEVKHQWGEGGHNGKQGTSLFP
jgi:enterochelin esterase-like enzyme